MDGLPYANSFQELVVYQKSKLLAGAVYELTKSFPPEELYSLTSQIRRASRSVGAQIAEAWAKRRYRKHFISKLSDADAEINETEHWVDTALCCGYIKSSEKERIVHVCHEIGRMLGSMMINSDRFCSD